MQTIERPKRWRPIRRGRRVEGMLYGIITDLQMNYIPPRSGSRLGYDLDGGAIEPPSFRQQGKGTLAITVLIENQAAYLPYHLDKILGYDPKKDGLIDYFKIYEIMVGKVGLIQTTLSQEPKKSRSPFRPREQNHKLANVFFKQSEAFEHWQANYGQGQRPDLVISHCFEEQLTLAEVTEAIREGITEGASDVSDLLLGQPRGTSLWRAATEGDKTARKIIKESQQ